MNDAQYTDLKADIRRLLDIDLDAYKVKQMRRRLESFVRRTSQEDVEGFRKVMLGVIGSAEDRKRFERR